MSPRELPEYPGERFSPETAPAPELKRLLAIRETQLAEYLDRTHVLESEIGDLRARIDEVQQARITAETESSVLRDQISAQQQEIGTLLDRRQQLESQLGQVRSEYDARLSEVVREAVEHEQRQHLQELQAIQAERAELVRTVENLQAQVGAAGETRSAPPSSIADSFVEAMQQVASREVADQPFNVSMARMEVEARGIFRAPTADSPPEFVTPPPGQVNPSELSTMRMEFRISPRAPGAQPSPT